MTVNILAYLIIKLNLRKLTTNLKFKTKLTYQASEMTYVIFKQA